MAEAKGKRKLVPQEGDKVRRGPAIGLVEVASLARGMVVCDAMVKRSPVDVLSSWSTTPGKYLVLVAGEVAEVEEAMQAGLDCAAEHVIDSMVLSNPHQQVVPGIKMELRPPVVDDPDDLGAVGIVEMGNVSGAIRGLDAALKGGEVDLFDLRLSRGIGGKALFCFCGDLTEVQAAVDAAETLVGPDLIVNREIIPRPHPDFVRRICEELL